jgi:hypothetical protein
MLKPKSPQASFYGNHLYDRIIPTAPPAPAPCPLTKSSPARGWMGQGFTITVPDIMTNHCSFNHTKWTNVQQGENRADFLLMLNLVAALDSVPDKIECLAQIDGVCIVSPCQGTLNHCCPGFTKYLLCPSRRSSFSILSRRAASSVGSLLNLPRLYCLFQC